MATADVTSNAAYVGVDEGYIKMADSRERAIILKQTLITTAATVDDGDQINFVLADHGYSTILGVRGITHTTANDVLVVEAPTTSADTSLGILRIVVGGSTDNLIRSFLVFGVE